MKASAFLLLGEAELSVASKIERILGNFGVESRRLPVAEFLVGENEFPARLFCSATTFLELITVLANDAGAASKWGTVNSAFVLAGDAPDCFEKVAQRITGNDAAVLRRVGADSQWSVSNEFPDVSDSMSGISTVAQIEERALVLNESLVGVAPIISCASGAGFVRVVFQGVPVFLSTGDVINIDMPLTTQTFDVRQSFMAAVPIVLYVKWAFSQYCWRTVESCACLVIDDPLLQPRYGHLNYQRLLTLMERLNFSTSIAFIPWNWRRSDRKTVRLFRENAKRFSVSIHGCDHTNAEYGGSDRARLAWKSHEAVERMSRHRMRTGLSHDNVMIFPQGVFSEAAIDSLKRDDFIGVVNSEVFSSDAQARPIKISDYWQVAVTNYCDFPIFTRRYPSQGIQNFAFDILLGKPCIIVVHHNDCHDDCREIAGLIEKLNNLKVGLRWTNLAEIVRRGFRQREITPGVVDVEISGVEARVENKSETPMTFRVRKNEALPGSVQEVRIAAQPVAWSSFGQAIGFEVKAQGGESKTVRISYAPSRTVAFGGERLSYRVKAMARRFLCEVRDNYLKRMVIPS